MPAGVLSVRSARNSDGVNPMLAAIVLRDWREAEGREADVMVISAGVGIVSGEWNCSDGATLAEGVGFEPTVSLTPRSISSRVP